MNNEQLEQYIENSIREIDLSVYHCKMRYVVVNVDILEDYDKAKKKIDVFLENFAKKAKYDASELYDDCSMHQSDILYGRILYRNQIADKEKSFSIRISSEILLWQRLISGKDFLEKYCNKWIV